MITHSSRVTRKKNRVRSKIFQGEYRLSVNRSSRFLFAQIIDQKNGKTILGRSDKKIAEKDDKKTKTQKAEEFGLAFAKEAVDKKIKKVVFDRGACCYHGRVKAFAEGVRKGGLLF